MAELGQQIARLMAAMTKAGQGSNPSSASREVMGGAIMVVTLSIVQTPTAVDAALNRPPQLAANLLGIGWGLGNWK